MTTATLPITERALQDAVVDLARYLGWKTFHVYDSRRSEAGWPDLALVRERLILIELKSAKGKLSAAQCEWLLALEDAGVETYIFRPCHWISGEIERILR